jgi:hypothetical protein
MTKGHTTVWRLVVAQFRAISLLFHVAAAQMKGVFSYRFATGAFLLASSAVFSDDMSGKASIVDGNALEVHGMRTRGELMRRDAVSFVGADDSLRYQCGAKAANGLDALIARPPVD